MSSNLTNILDVAIIVPYRNRESHLSIFTKIMPNILEDKNYEIIFVHQYDKRPFNRGAMKNIGLLYLKRYYPESYKNITMVINDIDTMPRYKNQFSYNTIPGKVEHYYGYTQGLGGIFSINAGDFEKINGFPNIWTWGLEDNILLKRCNIAGIKISRDTFVGAESKENMIMLDHGNIRYLSDYIGNKYHKDNGTNGIRSLYNLKLNTVHINKNIKELQVTSFETGESLKSPFVKSAKYVDISKRPSITFNKKAIIGGFKQKNTMLFKTFR